VAVRAVHGRVIECTELIAVDPFNAEAWRCVRCQSKKLRAADHQG
jgi:hypothetical protein